METSPHEDLAWFVSGRGEEKKKDFLTLLNAILIIGSVIFTVIFALATKDFMMTGILLIVSILFSIGFVYQYGAKRIERLNWKEWTYDYIRREGYKRIGAVESYIHERFFYDDTVLQKVQTKVQQLIPAKVQKC